MLISLLYFTPHSSSSFHRPRRPFLSLFSPLADSFVQATTNACNWFSRNGTAASLLPTVPRWQHDDTVHSSTIYFANRCHMSWRQITSKQANKGRYIYSSHITRKTQCPIPSPLLTSLKWYYTWNILVDQLTRWPSSWSSFRNINSTEFFLNEQEDRVHTWLRSNNRRVGWHRNTTAGRYIPHCRESHTAPDITG